MSEKSNPFVSPRIARLAPFAAAAALLALFVIAFVARARELLANPYPIGVDGYYYAVQVRLSEEMLAKMPEVEMVPGMPAEAMIKTGETTVAAYALSPVLDSFHRAFREK